MECESRPVAPKKLLILDVNGLLLHRIYKASPEARALGAVADVGHFTVFLRPHVREFLEWCKRHFHIALWGTALVENITPLLRLLDFEGVPVVVYGQGDCTCTGLRDPLTPAKFLYVKPLRRLWNDPRVAEIGDFDATNTLLLDDAPYKAAYNPPHTCVSPASWSATDPAWRSRVDDALSADGWIRQFLLEYRGAEDGRDVVRAWHATPDSSRWKCPSQCALLHRLRDCSPQVERRE